MEHCNVCLSARHMHLFMWLEWLLCADKALQSVCLPYAPIYVIRVVMLRRWSTAMFVCLSNAPFM